ncbi:glycoside hydrolase family 6 protein [Streptomyces sp. CC228A]|uniref:glycoside hydrolase family 6 protein n=1 Tax=Streptomyces sp. CC228A TaxID=2898186 RepID=UPI0027E465E0|nr:glycoside hydrolase family 6 protein [Streptomyces sp. CC228A]
MDAAGGGRRLGRGERARRPARDEALRDRLQPQRPRALDGARGAYPDAQEWCNPPDRGLGARPTTRTGEPLHDARLWIKIPGESDGLCLRGTPGPEDPARGTVDPRRATGSAAGPRTRTVRRPAHRLSRPQGRESGAGPPGRRWPRPAAGPPRRPVRFRPRCRSGVGGAGAAPHGGGAREE